MKNIPIEKMQELFDKSFSEVFNDRHASYDSVDRTLSSKILMVKGIQAFYFTVSLKLIEKYLTEITEK